MSWKKKISKVSKQVNEQMCECESLWVRKWEGGGSLSEWNGIFFPSQCHFTYIEMLPVIDEITVCYIFVMHGRALQLTIYEVYKLNLGSWEDV